MAERGIARQVLGTEALLRNTGEKIGFMLNSARRNDKRRLLPILSPNLHEGGEYCRFSVPRSCTGFRSTRIQATLPRRWNNRSAQQKYGEIGLVARFRENSGSMQDFFERGL